MDVQQFLEEFGHIARAPKGVTRLRELVLQLAISGRLTERVPNDVTASILIERNREKQQALVTHKQLKRQHEPKPVDSSRVPWALPEGWEWVRLGAVTNYGDAPKVEFDDVTEDTWVLELEDIEKSTSRLLVKVQARDRKFKSTKNGFPASAVLYGKLRPYLDKVIIAESAGVCTTEISPISFFYNIQPGYLRWYLKSPYFIAYANGSTYGMNLPRLGTSSAREALFPFPPEQEQTRIVAKVDELMALCDTLEMQKQSRRKLQSSLRQAALQALANAQSPHELQDSWVRLEANFGRLFGAPEDVASMRDVVFDLALRGALLPESQLTSVAGKASDELPALPNEWEWKNLNTLAEYITSGSRGWKSFVTHSGDAFIRSQDIKHDVLIFENPAFVTLPSKAEGKRTLVRQDDLLLTITGGNVGKCAIVPPMEGNGYVSQHVALIRLQQPWLARYVHFWMINTFGGRGFLARYIYGDKPGLNLAQVGSVPIPIPPKAQAERILNSLVAYRARFELLERQLKTKQNIALSLAIAVISNLTGVAVEQEEESVKVPQTELISRLRLGKAPSVKAQAPLATILARHNGELSTQDLWQRSTLDIDAFYAQLKTEVAHGWIEDPSYELDESAPDGPKKYPNGRLVAQVLVKEGT